MIANAPELLQENARLRSRIAELEVTLRWLQQRQQHTTTKRDDCVASIMDDRAAASAAAASSIIDTPVEALNTHESSELQQSMLQSTASASSTTTCSSLLTSSSSSSSSSSTSSPLTCPSSEPLNASSSLSKDAPHHAYEHQSSDSSTRRRRRYHNHNLSTYSIHRYSRHLLIDSFGARPTASQSALLKSSVLVIGAGGLGSPCLLYLAAAGVGHITIVDPDIVDASNLTRQVCHEETAIGAYKAISAAQAVQRLNSKCSVAARTVSFTSSNALQLARSHHVIVDCSDNVQTRYVCNDAAVILGIPLVSGSALRMEGQLTVYNAMLSMAPANGQGVLQNTGDAAAVTQRGCCMRCIFPRPPAAHFVTACSDGGMLGAVTGIIGSWQAMETVKLCVQINAHDLSDSFETLGGRLLLFDGNASTTRVVKLRAKSIDCRVCGLKPTVHASALNPDSIAYDEPQQDDYSSQLLECPSATASSVDHEDTARNRASSITNVSSVTVQDLNEQLMRDEQSSSPSSLLLDVRPALQFDICHLHEAINTPLQELQSCADVEDYLKSKFKHSLGRHLDLHNDLLYVMCRRGIDSLTATELLMRRFPAARVLNVQGGLVAWSRYVDADCPLY